LEDWLDTARQLKEMGTLFILLTGGEPMLYPHFKELYTALREMGFILTINTNGTLIDEDIARMFQRLKPRRVNVTLYGASNETYQQLCRSPHGFDQCMKGLQLLKAHGIDTKMNLSIVQENVHEYPQLLDIARQLDIPAEVNSYMFSCTRSTCQPTRDITKHRLDAHQAGLAEMEYLRYKKGKDFKAYAQGMAQNFQQGVYATTDLGLDCRAGKSSCWFDWRGRLTPCCVMEEPAVILKGTTVAEAWKQIVTTSESLPKHTECNGCSLRMICDVCYAAACHEKKACGNLNYLCEMSRTKKEAFIHETN
jgi:MoaA/NifB/PqqE/SkfB family radical SAM enzyme